MIEVSALPLASVMSCIAESQRLTIEYVVEACFGDAERLARLTSAVNRLALLEFDIMHRYAKKLDRAVISSERQTLAGDFDRSIASLVQDTDGVREQLAKHPMEIIGKELRDNMLWKDSADGDKGLDSASN